MSDIVKDWIWGFVIAIAIVVLWKACDSEGLEEDPAVESDSVSVASEENYEEEDSTYIVDGATDGNTDAVGEENYEEPQ